jgi:small-conductance mechanosensitive channel
MKAIISFLGKLIKKRWLPMPGKETHDILQRGRKASKIPEYYYYIKYATSVLRVIAWVVLVLGFIGALFWGITMGGIEGGLRIVLVIIGSFLAWLALLAARELLKLFMDVKENTENTAERATITSTRKSR